VATRVKTLLATFAPRRLGSGGEVHEPCANLHVSGEWDGGRAPAQRLNEGGRGTAGGGGRGKATGQELIAIHLRP
jgi:hypothetical protein